MKEKTPSGDMKDAVETSLLPPYHVACYQNTGPVFVFERARK